MTTDTRPMPLAGIRVLDLGQAAVGPIAAEYLGELGADVIKVESPEGDSVRRGRPRLNGMGHTFLGNNLTKRGVMLDLKNAEDHAAAERLIATADVLIENFRSPAVLKRLGLGYDRMSEINPRLIYVQSSAYGPRGPMEGMTSNEWFAQASAGLTSVTGAPGQPGEFSRGTASMDWNGAFVNLEAILIALYVRERTGKGMMIYTSQFQSALIASTTRLAEYFATGQLPERLGSGRPNVVPDQAFATSDGYVTVTVPHNGFWTRFCRAVGHPELVDDPRYVTNDARVANRATLVAALDAVFATETAAEWVARLRAADVPVGEFQHGPNLSASLLEHPQVQAEHLVSVFDTPWGAMATAEPHWKFDKTQARITRPAPAHGEHTQEIMRELGVEIGGRS